MLNARFGAALGTVWAPIGPWWILNVDLESIWALFGVPFGAPKLSRKSPLFVTALGAPWGPPRDLILDLL